MAKLIKTHGCSVNILDPRQKRIHDYIESHTNKSEYLKSLVERDMYGASTYPAHESVPQFDPDFEARDFI